MNYVFLKARIHNESKGSKNDGIDDIQLLAYSYIKTDNKFNVIDKGSCEVKLKDIGEYSVINKLIDVMDNSRLIGYDLSKTLIAILSGMYRWQIFNLSFKYFDIKYCGEKNIKINKLDDMIKFMKQYSDSNLDNVKYQKKNTNGYQLLSVFRGLHYSLYPLDKGYYMYDESSDRYLSFYVHKKELAKEWDYTLKEYLLLKRYGANFITSLLHLSEETTKITNEYLVYSDCDLSKYKYLIRSLEKSLKYLENNPDLNISLVCIGKIEELKNNYKILGEGKLNKILSLITREKDLWSKW